MGLRKKLRQRPAVDVSVSVDRAIDTSGGELTAVRRAVSAAYRATLADARERERRRERERESAGGDSRRIRESKRGSRSRFFAHVILTGDEGIKSLNRRLRGKDEPTDVLSFPQIGVWESLAKPGEGESAEIRTGRYALGDIAISLDSARAQGDLYNHGFLRELSFLTVHGMLHLLGYDHEKTVDERNMRKTQRGAMTALGFAAPTEDADEREEDSDGSEDAASDSEDAASADEDTASDSEDAAPADENAAGNAGVAGADEDHRAGFIALVGKANVGKSTLANALAGEALAVVTDKPQTTRKNLRLIVTYDDCQYIFVDTPGLHDPRNKLGERMVRSALSAVKDVDAVALIIDARDRELSRDDLAILESARRHKKPVTLFINKVDLIEKTKLLPLIDSLSKRFGFMAIIPISAKKEPELSARIALEQLRKSLPRGSALYPTDSITDGAERDMVADRVRGAALELLNQEIPHGVEIEIEQFHRDEAKGLISVRATVICEKESHKRIIVGKDGVSLKRIGSVARSRIEPLLGARVFLELWVKVRKDWRDDAAELRRMGYGD